MTNSTNSSAGATSPSVPNFRNLNLEVFRNPAGARPFFQPRIDFWISENRRKGTLPERYHAADPLEIHRDLGCSMRPYKLFNPCLTKEKYGSIRIEQQRGDDGQAEVTRWVTPFGTLEQVRHQCENAHHISQWAVRGPEHFRALEYILRDQVFEWDQALYERENARLGDLGAPQLFIPRVNLMRLMVHWMGMEATMLALMTELEKTERLIEVINEKEEECLRVVAATPVPIINYGDNIDCHMAPPNYLLRYIRPQYARRTEVLRAAGKFVHSHFDGWMKSLLPCFREMPLDGIEALTPLPQGDVTIEQLREALPPGMVLIDGIPMTCFLPSTPIEALDACVERLIELFAPRLILGISDELSPVCDIERVRRVARRVHCCQKDQAFS